MPLTVTTSTASNNRAAIACTSGTAPYVIYGYTSNNRWLVRGSQVTSYPTTTYTFGANITGWLNAGYGSTVWDSTNGRTVAGSLSNTFGGTFSGSVVYVNGVVPGETWTISLYVKAVSIAQTVTGYVTYRTSGGTFISQTSSTAAATTSGWTLLTITTAAPSLADYFSLEIYSGVGSTNYVSNPGAETNLTGLVSTNASTVARSTAQAHSGVASMLMTTSIVGSSAASGTPRPGGGTTIAVTAGDTYNASAWVLNNVGTRRYRLRILWWNAGGGIVGDTASPATALSTAGPATWSMLYTSGVAPVGATQASVEIDAYTSGAISDSVYIDDINLNPSGGMLIDDVTITSNRAIKTAYDNAVPLRLATYYEVTDATSTKVTAGPVYVDQANPVLADALYPSLNTEIVLVAQKPNTWEARSVWFDVLGRQDPLPVVAPLRYRNGTIKIRAAEPADRAELLSLLTTGRPLLLRQPCHNMSADDVYLLPLRVTESPTIDNYHAGPATFDIEYQAVTRDIGVEWAEPRTYATFTTESATYAILATAWSSYANAAGGVPT